MDTGENNIEIGSAVRVNKGVLDPDIEEANASGEWWDDVSLAGWVGVVTEIEKSDNYCSILVEWDSQTLRRAPSVWKEFLYQHYAFDPEEFGYCWLSCDKVLPTKERDSSVHRVNARRDIEIEFDRRQLIEWLDEELDKLGVLYGAHSGYEVEVDRVIDIDAKQKNPKDSDLKFLKRLCVSYKPIRWWTGDCFFDDLEVDIGDTDEAVRAILNDGNIAVIVSVYHGDDWQGDDSFLPEGHNGEGSYRSEYVLEMRKRVL